MATELARDARRRGSALLPSLLVVVAMSGLSVAIFTMGMANTKETKALGREIRALYVAEAGLGQTLLQLGDQLAQGEPAPVEVGTENDPVDVPGGSYWATVTDNGDETYTLTCTGAVGSSRRTLESLVEAVGESVFDHAIFAGNTSGDPAYTLRLGGTGGQADQITGNIFANGDVEVTGDASIVGDLLAAGTILGAPGVEGVSRPLPDIAGMDYANTSDVDVAQAFATSGTVQSNDLGGNAAQVPEDDPAHIFRKNPDDRVDEITGTAKDDYFLEDPYMPVKDFTDPISGNEGHTISLSGAPTRPGPIGNELVYFIDGNLWIHNKPFGRLRFDGAPEGTRVTFVVKGNVYFSDDVLLKDQVNDAVAFVAIKDPAHLDSGNIYLGDPRYGTIDRLHTYLYAENNFYDLNLDETGSKTVEVFGNMTAGNHVAIERDWVDPDDGSVQHSRLSVHFDDRLSTSAVELPGLPRVSAGVAGYRSVYHREVAER